LLNFSVRVQTAMWWHLSLHAYFLELNRWTSLSHDHHHISLFLCWSSVFPLWFSTSYHRVWQNAHKKVSTLRQDFRVKNGGIYLDCMGRLT
jgi:hypothetical protein